MTARRWDASEPSVRQAAWVCVLGLIVSAAASGQRGDADKPLSPAPVKLEVQGLHNVFRVCNSILSGSGPEGEQAFAVLQKLGIRTVISVDGARPDVAQARKYGLRYVHIPIGYNGVSRQQALQIARAVRELPGPFYIHCHHGKHRGPTAAAVARLCADEKCGTADALAVLQSAGTDPRYQGLFKSVQEFQRPTAQELAALPGRFPGAANVAGLTQAMVTIDHCWDNLKLVRNAGWKGTPDHPDIDPAHEALQLVEGFQELRRLPELKNRPEEFRNWVADAHESAKELEQLLRMGTARKAAGGDAAERVYRRVGALCTQCHARYRDAP
jgi:protein tyrosine phosphatase (PTP) superfamily phosphohydrolase (DUF442 family)